MAIVLTLKNYLSVAIRNCDARHLYIQIPAWVVILTKKYPQSTEFQV